MNAGKGTVENLSHIGRAGGPFSRMQTDFIEMPVHGGLKYVLVIVCIFSQWIEAYPTRRNDSLTVAKLLLRELIPRFGFPISLESDRGSHFNNEVIKLLCAALNIEQKLHCSYRPEASVLVEQMNGTLKSRMAKICASTYLKWPDALPLVLMSIRNTPDKKTGLSPHEILMGRAMRLRAVPANALLNITDDMVLDYCKGLADVVRSFSHQVEANTLPPIQGPGHALKAGDWVVIKKHVGKSCLEPRWKGPFQVILTTTTAVKCAPTEQREPGGEQAEIEEGEIFSEEETTDSFEEDQGEASGSDEDPEGDKEPATGEGAGEPEQRRAFPEEDDTGKEKENLIDLLGEEDKIGQSETVQTLPEPVAGPSGENSAKLRQSISPVKLRTREILNESEGPKLKEKRKEVSVAITTPSEEKDPAKEESTSERESKGDAKLKRKRIPSRRYSGPEWAYIATNDWSGEFLSLSLENEEAERHFGT
ncbi:hypothetical protein NDU88_000308 [Pleurodeles waltl]|uniref:Integrase catalytic domain-containing protein n=1 Tax=Pleurodeles waltl TaxID=8319 RepID=A0AAV7VXQ7_PLEWA|nr:hypothetical protein NDU88_000308 [Pleurodeles waltl]